MEIFGHFALVIAFVVSLYIISVSVFGIKKKREELLKSAENGVTVVFCLLNCAVFSLFYLLLRSDFHVKYVANYTNHTLPLIYKLAAFWGGQEGSLLLWGWLLGLFAFIIVIQYRKKGLVILPYIIFVIMGTISFFIFLNVFLSNPFDVFRFIKTNGELTSFIPGDGNGLNPLLQHPLMIIHPPLTFIGYAGFTVPFAFAISSIFTRKLGDVWINYTRRWTLFSWFFLGIGIILGARWAYVELGWGGYWSWDPVENASLMPWLTGIAFLHSVIIQEKKGMLKVWNVVLILLTFVLCIFGTFITRSGIISSVHAFAESSIGWYFLGFIIIVLVSSIFIIMRRMDYLKSSHKLDAILSRESGFFYNNIVFFGACLIILFGTVFSTISEAIADLKITLGPQFFNRIFFPIGIFLLILIGITPLLAFRKTSLKNLKKSMFLPTLLSIILCLILIIFGLRNFNAFIYFIMISFVTFVIIMEFYKGISMRIKRKKEKFLSALINLINYNKRRYGGYVVHLGIIFMFMGITGSFFNKETEKMMEEGDEIIFKNYQITLKEIRREDHQNYFSESLFLEVYKNKKLLGKFSPEKRIYKASNQTTSEVRIHSTLKEDIYMIYAGKASDNNKVVIQVLWNPLVKWIWIGTFILSIGTIILFLPDSKKIIKIEEF